MTINEQARMTPRMQLSSWVRRKHQGQFIRRTAQTYFNHLIFVAEKVDDAIVFGYEIGLCHDLLEDTATSVAELREALLAFGYDKSSVNTITRSVVELSDVFTKKAYPELSKTLRKEKEAIRLSDISDEAQTVKYADLIDNINWVLRHDRENAVPYLQRKQILVLQMDRGDAGLRSEALKLIETSLSKLMLSKSKKD